MKFLQLSLAALIIFNAATPSAAPDNQQTARDLYRQCTSAMRTNPQDVYESCKEYLRKYPRDDQRNKVVVIDAAGNVLRLFMDAPENRGSWVS